MLKNNWIILSCLFICLSCGSDEFAAKRTGETEATKTTTQVGTTSPSEKSTPEVLTDANSGTPGDVPENHRDQGMAGAYPTQNGDRGEGMLPPEQASSAGEGRGMTPDGQTVSEGKVILQANSQQIYTSCALNSFGQVLCDSAIYIQHVNFQSAGKLKLCSAKQLVSALSIEYNWGKAQGRTLISSEKAKLAKAIEVYLQRWQEGACAISLNGQEVVFNKAAEFQEMLKRL